MDFDAGESVLELRTELRALIARELPPDFLGAFSTNPLDFELTQSFCATLAEERQLCPAWPTEFGGRNASLWEQTAVREEMWAAHEPRGAQYMGVNWVGPIIFRHGTSAQQQLHLGPIARGEVIWCQGFSEPDSGSDLASLSTSAIQDGDTWRITGQKIWTSYASMADWCFLLARTSRHEARQAGITIFLIPLNSPGVDVRPIGSMLGPHHLNEVFLNDVEVGPESVLGPLGEGWTIVQEVLALERVGIARYARCDRLLAWAPRALGQAFLELSEELRIRWSRCGVHTRRARLLAYRVIDRQSKGTLAPQDAAAYRLAVTSLDQEAAGVLGEIAEFSPQNEEGRRFAAAVADHVRYSVASTVASGSSEMQKILLARSLIGSR